MLRIRKVHMMFALVAALAVLTVMPISAHVTNEDVELTDFETFFLFSGHGLNGNVKADEDWTGPGTVGTGKIEIRCSANFDGNIESKGTGGIRVCVGDGDVFNGNIKSEGGTTTVTVRILDGGLFNGNVEVKDGSVDVTVFAGGRLNGNVKVEAGTCTVTGDIDGNEEGVC